MGWKAGRGRGSSLVEYWIGVSDKGGGERNSISCHAGSDDSVDFRAWSLHWGRG